LVVLVVARFRYRLIGLRPHGLGLQLKAAQKKRSFGASNNSSFLTFFISGLTTSPKKASGISH
jgi:hypothetical protein